MKGLKRYLKGYELPSVLGPLFKLCEAALELIVPLIIAKIVDRGILAGDGAYAVKMALVLVLFGAVGLCFSVTAQFFCAKASVGFATRVRRALFTKVQTLSYSDLDKAGTSTLITRMTSDTAKVQNGLNLTLRLLLRSPFIVFGAMIMAFTVDLSSALVFTVAIPLLSVVVFGILLSTIPLYKKVQKNTDGVLEKTRENLSGVRVIRAFCKEEEERAEFKERNGALTAAVEKVGAISALLNPLTYVLINLAIIYLVYVGALRVDSGALTTGEVLALYNYMSQILVELIKLANLIISITRALASASRISDTLAIIPTENMGKSDLVTEGEEAVRFDGVSLRYGGAGECSLSDISFSVKAGQTVGIIGGTGSGKSSLVNLIPGFYKATEGEVRIFGKAVEEYSAEAIREAVGVVPQGAVLFSGSIRDNMLWGKADATDEEIMAAVKLAQAENVVSDKGGLDAVIEQGGRNLSGGQRQRLTIARALVRKPKLLILDDAASALDYATDAALRIALRKITDTTVFIVSQRASSVMHADLIIVLEDGEAVGMGTHGELLESNEVYKEIYYSQFEEKGVKTNG